MIKKRRFIAVGIAAYLLISSPVIAQNSTHEKKVSLEAKIDFLSHNAFRGFLLSEKPLVKTSAGVSYQGFRIEGATNYDTVQDNINQALGSLDYTIPFSKALSLTLGYALTAFPNTEQKKTQEVYSLLGIKSPGNHSLLVVHDFDQGKGNYGELSFNHPITLGSATLTPNMRIGYNNHFYREKSGFSHLQFGTGLAIPITSNIMVIPHLEVTKSLDRRNFKDTFYGGLKLEFRW